MTQHRLDELMDKAKNSSVSREEIAEICGSILESTSRHSKEIKTRLNQIEEKLVNLQEKLNEIREKLSPAFGVIIEDEEDEEYDEEED